MEACLRLKEVYELRDEFESLLAREALDLGEARLERDVSVARLQYDPFVAARLYSAARAQGDGEVDRGRAGVEEVQGPDVNRPSGQINPRRRCQIGRASCRERV